MEATLRDIFITPGAGEPMTRRERVAVVRGGLAGDRYQRGDGHYQLDACEVTLVEAEALHQIQVAAGLDLTAGQHRRNLVTKGIELDALRAATFRIGDAVFRGTRPRPPCAYLDTVADLSGIANALTERGGICADVVAEGEIAVGDRVEIVEADPRTAGKAIADRLAAREQSGR